MSKRVVEYRAAPDERTLFGLGLSSINYTELTEAYLMLLITPHTPEIGALTNTMETTATPNLKVTFSIVDGR